MRITSGGLSAENLSKNVLFPVCRFDLKIFSSHLDGFEVFLNILKTYIYFELNVNWIYTNGSNRTNNMKRKEPNCSKTEQIFVCVTVSLSSVRLAQILCLNYRLNTVCCFIKAPFLIFFFFFFGKASLLQCFPCFCFYYFVLQHIHIHINDVVFDVSSRLRKLTFNVFRLLCSYACTCTVCQCQCQCQSQTRPYQCERKCGYVQWSCVCVP